MTIWVTCFSLLNFFDDSSILSSSKKLFNENKCDNASLFEIGAAFSPHFFMAPFSLLVCANWEANRKVAPQSFSRDLHHHFDGKTFFRQIWVDAIVYSNSKKKFQFSASHISTAAIYFPWHLLVEFSITLFPVWKWLTERQSICLSVSEVKNSRDCFIMGFPCSICCKSVNDASFDSFW